MPKKVLVKLPAGLLEQIDFVAQVEHRNRSDLIRESLRRYLEQFTRSSRALAPIVRTVDPAPVDVTDGSPGATAAEWDRVRALIES